MQRVHNFGLMFWLLRAGLILGVSGSHPQPAHFIVRAVVVTGLMSRTPVVVADGSAPYLGYLLTPPMLQHVFVRDCW